MHPLLISVRSGKLRSLFGREVFLGYLPKPKSGLAQLIRKWDELFVDGALGNEVRSDLSDDVEEHLLPWMISNRDFDGFELWVVSNRRRPNVR